MADWGAGWANAARGVSDAFNMYAGAKMNERERVAEEARRLKEAKRQELQELRKMQFQREMANEDRMFRTKTTKQAQAFEAEQAAAQRALTGGYYDQQARLQQANIDLQREEMAQRERMTGMGLAGRGGGGGSERAAVSDSILNNIRTEFRNIDPQEAYQMAIQKYGREIADAAFGGVGGARDQAAGFMGSLSRNVSRYFQE